MNDQTLRIVDANLARATEGLRVLEDIARFVLDSTSISRSLKELRHSLHQAFPDVSINLISARDSASDVGRLVEYEKEPAINLADTVIANARRVEQSLRVLEETSRLPDSLAKAAIFEEARYSMYELEKELVSLLSRACKCLKLGSYYVVENETQFSDAIERKVTALQFVPGILTQREYYDLAKDFRERCTSNAILLIIGGRLGIAIASDADGIVLDENSLPISAARDILKIDQLIGYSAKSLEEAIQAESRGADYILCPKTLKEAISSEVKIPVIAPFERIISD
jgi:thiamine-phosphate pyrophosphorylase